MSAWMIIGIALGGLLMYSFLIGIALRLLRHFWPVLEDVEVDIVLAIFWPITIVGLCFYGFFLLLRKPALWALRYSRAPADPPVQAPLQFPIAGTPPLEPFED